jgi:hypothetical protein
VAVMTLESGTFDTGAVSRRGVRAGTYPTGAGDTTDASSSSTSTGLVEGSAGPSCRAIAERLAARGAGPATVTSADASTDTSPTHLKNVLVFSLVDIVMMIVVAMDPRAGIAGLELL